MIKGQSSESLNFNIFIYIDRMDSEEEDEEVGVVDLAEEAREVHAEEDRPLNNKHTKYQNDVKCHVDVFHFA